MPDKYAQMRIQGFVSLVCRYPFFRLDEDDDEEMKEYFKRRSTFSRFIFPLVEIFAMYFQDI